MSIRTYDSASHDTHTTPYKKNPAENWGKFLQNVTNEANSLYVKTPQ